MRKTNGLSGTLSPMPASPRWTRTASMKVLNGNCLEHAAVKLFESQRCMCVSCKEKSMLGLWRKWIAALPNSNGSYVDNI